MPDHHPNSDFDQSPLRHRQGGPTPPDSQVDASARDFHVGGVSRLRKLRSRGRPAGMRAPAETFFDFKKADNWHLDIGQIPPAAGSIRFMSSLRAVGYP
jgi:hypothetical protein